LICATNQPTQLHWSHHQTRTEQESELDALIFFLAAQQYRSVTIQSAPKSQPNHPKKKKTTLYFEMSTIYSLYLYTHLYIGFIYLFVHYISHSAETIRSVFTVKTSTVSKGKRSTKQPSAQQHLTYRFFVFFVL
jgi:hypothetical protein